MQKKKIALLSILSGIVLLIIWVILPMFVSNKGIIFNFYKWVYVNWFRYRLFNQNKTS